MGYWEFVIDLPKSNPEDERFDIQFDANNNDSMLIITEDLSILYSKAVFRMATTNLNTPRKDCGKGEE